MERAISRNKGKGVSGVSMSSRRSSFSFSASTGSQRGSPPFGPRGIQRCGDCPQRLEGKEKKQKKRASLSQTPSGRDYMRKTHKKSCVRCAWDTRSHVSRRSQTRARTHGGRGATWHVHACACSMHDTRDTHVRGTHTLVPFCFGQTACKQHEAGRCSDAARGVSHFGVASSWRPGLMGGIRPRSSA